MFNAPFYSVARWFTLLSIVFSTPIVADEHGADEPQTRLEIYGQGVRETTKRDSASERQGFHLPTGFEIQLFAAEPNIAKPMNMAFDARGRLWVTSTVEYPYPASDRPGRDSIRILEDTDGDGAADKFKTFADELNIPIGILPVHDGVICFSIPYIWHLRDTNHDDVCDERIKLLGPFDTSRDTHGMINAMRRGWDGWLYACHGFNNQSNVTAKDGSNIRLTSGNTFRFREDGSRVEQFTQGQVNPFGMARDEWGNWYTADCHSKPITFLLHRGCYPSFGRPHDGSGFVPDMMSHAHGSTAICGIVYLTDSSFPAKFRDRLYSGNVMTSRINSNRLERIGTTVKAIEMPDFLTSDDPWFRPVDLQWGPDGALYVADFYNKIIGHYEVPLTHPERDRDSGRIWRIIWRGKSVEGTSQAKLESNDTKRMLASESILDDQFFSLLDSDNPTIRDLTLDRLLVRPLGGDRIARLRSRLIDARASAKQRIASLWGLHRAIALDETCLAAALDSGISQLEAAALRSLADHSSRSAQMLSKARAMLASPEPQVQLAAVAALATIGQPSDVRGLLATGRAKSEADSIFRHAIKLAARELLKSDEGIEQVLAGWRTSALTSAVKTPSSSAAGLPTAIAVDDALAIDVARILPAIASERASEALLVYVTRHRASHSELLDGAIEHACRNLPLSAIDSLLALVLESASNDLVRLSELTERVGITLRARNATVPDQFKMHAQLVADRHAQALRIQTQSAAPTIDWRESRGRAWLEEKRRCADGQNEVPFYSSLTLGEDHVGTWSTEPFAAPAKLTFWIAGHNGLPASRDSTKNLVRLIDATDRNILRSVAAPRNDVAQLVEWDLADLSGRPVLVECVDGDRRRAYAWIAVGRFSEPRLNPSLVPRLVDSLARVFRLQLPGDPKQLLLNLISSTKLSRGEQLRLFSAAAESRGELTLAALISYAEKHRPQLLEPVSLASGLDELQELELATQVVQSLTSEQQRTFVRSVLGESRGRKLIVKLTGRGTIAFNALRGARDFMPARQDDAEIGAIIELSRQADQMLDERPGVLIQRLEKLDLVAADVEVGRSIFEKQCAICHQLAGRGQTVGPQLDGVGARGSNRLAEDILLPNRNVDLAFRVTTLLFDDGKVVAGLVRELPDGGLTITGTDGKSTPINATSVTERRATTRSLMPENYAETLNDQDLAAVLAYLSKFAGQQASNR